MIPAMTVEDPGRETRLVPVAGRNIVVRQLTETQMLHLMRHAKILSADVENDLKLDSMDRMLKILNSVAVQDDDRNWLVEAQETGEVDIKDMLGWVRAFQDEKKPTVRRARARR